MRSVAVTRPGTVELVDVPRPEPGPYEALVHTECSFICNATDRKIIEGHFPGIEASNYPVLLGHESVGIVEETGPRVRSFSAGQRVIGGLLLSPPGGRFGSAWGGNSDYVIVPDYAALTADGMEADEVFKIMRAVPEDIPPEAAGLLCTFREVYAGFSDFRLTGSERIVIFGAGPVGLSFVRFARLKGFPWIASVDPIAEKRALALSMGADAVYSPEEDIETAIEKEGGGKVDAVIDAVGHESIINRALGMVRMAGSICVYGVVSSATVSVEKHRGPYNFNLFVHQWPTRDAEAAAQEPLCDWIRSGELDWRPFVSGRYPVERFGDAVGATRGVDAVKTMITYR
ncbi:zinc-dependent alcohol dehydrogenase [Salinispira pacifica]